MKKAAKGVLVVVVLAAALLVLFLIAVTHDLFTEDLVYADSLDLVAATVEGQDLTLYDLAFYIAYEEQAVNEQAYVYDPDHPDRYWNVHTNGEFLRVTARSTAVDMMIHDYVYATEAAANGLALSTEEKDACASSAEDFWNDLTQAQRDALGIPVEEVYTVCEQIGLAEKQMMKYAEQEGRDLAVFQVGGTAWEEKRDAMDIQYNERVLKRIEMGQVTVNQKDSEGRTEPYGN